MKKPLLPALLWLGLVTCAAACSRESEARSTLKNYDTPFGLCKEQTEVLRIGPREHRCAAVSSMALDVSMKRTGLDDAAIRKMRDAWLDETGYRPFYIPLEERPEGYR